MTPTMLMTSNVIINCINGVVVWICIDLVLVVVIPDYGSNSSFTC